MKQNSVQLIGYVGGDPKIIIAKNGSKLARVRVATHYKTKTAGDEKKYITTWHDVVAWEMQADYAERSFVKGSRILVGGCICYRTYCDTKGNIRYVAEIKADTLINLDR